MTEWSACSVPNVHGGVHDDWAEQGDTHEHHAEQKEYTEERLLGDKL